MLSQGPGQGVDPRLSAGAFCIQKSEGKFRLICDRRVRNCLQVMIGKARLPKASRLSRVFLPPSHRMLISSRDLKDYYYLCNARSREHLQPWGPRVPASWFADLGSAEKDFGEVGDEWWWPDLASMRRQEEAVVCPASFVQPLATVFMMGDLDTVFVVQQAQASTAAWLL